MKKFIFLFFVFLCSFILIACKDDKKDNSDVDFTVKVNEYIGIDKTYNLEAYDKDGKLIEAEWSIDDESIASIDGSTITGLDKGILTITATYKGKKVEAFCVVDNVKTIKYELDGGTCDNLEEEIFETKVYSLPTPVKEGYIFLGWYSNQSFSGNAVSELNSKNFSISTLYAVWHSEEYEIKYNLVKDSGEEEFKESSLFKTDYQLKTPEYDENELVFSGWYLDKRLYEKIEAIPAGTTKDIEVFGVLKNKDEKINITYVATDSKYEGGTNKDELLIGSNNFKTPERENYTFLGWYKDSKYQYSANDGIYLSSSLYAKFEETYKVSEVIIKNTETEIARKSTLQLEYSLNPSKVSVSTVTYSSSDSSIACVSSTGLVTAISKGNVTITITSKSESGASASISMEIYDNEYFNVSYDTESYVLKGEEIKLNANFNARVAKDVKLKWESLNPSIASVSDGKVKGLAKGNATIRVSVDGDDSKYFDFNVYVYEENISDALKFILASHNSNVFTRYNLGIGAGSPVYYKDIIGSVSKILFNYNYQVNTKYEAAQQAISSNHGGLKPSTEFITVHYTGNMASGASGAANANYFTSGGGGTSIHYVTGNDGVYHCLDDDLVGFHAGDGHSEDTQCEWYATGVMYKEGDSIYPTWGISENSKYTLNGQETLITVPTGTTPATQKVTDSKWINKMGFGYKIVDGQYYMNKTWWCYTQISEGRLCNKGGNMNSVGIESAVNEGTDLWLTWQITAELVARLMLKYDLPIQRVVGHHFYSAKNCPQPHLENNLEIWWEFIELVKAEYERITTFDGYKFDFAVINGPSDNMGRVSDGNEFKLITYKVTITNPNNSKEEIILSSIIKGQFAL